MIGQVIGRMVMYGYRYGEVPLDKLNASDAKIKVYRSLPDPTYRPPVQVSMGPHVWGAALPHADPGDPSTIIAGAKHRFLRRPLVPDPELMAEYKLYVRNYVKKKLIPLPYDSDVSVITWLNNTNYPKRRRDQLMQTYLECPTQEQLHKMDHKGRQKYLDCLSFMKDETYASYKHARAINSRTDQFKCHIGPIIKLIEKEVFKNGDFIKKVPIADRPKYILNRLGETGEKKHDTDYTSFEASFQTAQLEIEYELYDHMTQNLPEKIRREFLENIRVLSHSQRISTFKYFECITQGIRQSGEMNTSLGNGFMNKMNMKFAAYKAGCTKLRKVVEGDDALFRCNGEFPKEDFFARLGFIIKMNSHLEASTASFCGNVFDERECINVTNPMEVIVGGAYTSFRYLKANNKTLMKLLRCKALSYAHQYPGSPVIAAYARYLLRVTKGFDVRHVVKESKAFNEWEREQLLQYIDKKIPDVEVGRHTRVLVAHLYDMPISHQIHLEKYFDSLNGLTPLVDPVLQFHVPPVWSSYAEKYGMDIDPSSPQLAHPILSLDKMAGFVEEWKLH